MKDGKHTHDAPRGQDLLVPLGRTDLQLADPAADVRGRQVKDRHGDDIGHVEHLYIDPAERRVRFLEVVAGGFLGMGERRFLIPVDAVTAVRGDNVHLDQTREHVTGAPAYDPTLEPTHDPTFWEAHYGHYSRIPYWRDGYTYPPFPYV